MAGPNKGLLRGIGAALGELFTGGKLEPQQEVLVQVSFGLLGYLAGADSIVTTHEADFANQVMEDMHLPANGRDLAQAAFVAGRKRQIDVDVEMKRLLGTFPTGSAEVIKLYEALLELAIADGRVRPPERIFLEKVTKGLGFSPQALAARLGEAAKG